MNKHLKFRIYGDKCFFISRIENMQYVWQVLLTF